MAEEPDLTAAASSQEALNDNDLESMSNLLGQLEGGRLKATLDAAIGTLQTRFQITDSNFGMLTDPDSQGAQIAQMFAEVIENFESLFGEIKGMRSSYLPFALATETVDTDQQYKTLEEIIDAEALMESNENTFFRLLGMPSTTDIDDSDYLAYITMDGVLKEDPSFVKEKYMAILDTRQLDKTSRPFTASNAMYNMVAESDSYLKKLQALGYSTEATATLITNSDLLSEIVRAGAGGANIEGDDAAETFKTTAKTLLNNLVSLGGDKAVIQPILEFFVGTIDSSSTGASDSDQSKDTFRGLVIRAEVEDRQATFEAIEQALLDGLYQELILGNTVETMQDIATPANFFKLSYLLYPPVQDGRIASCINEPRKMVAPPFLEESLRTVNGQPLKSTLLEAIIRIRLDTISGTVTYMPDPSAQGGSGPVSAGHKNVELTYEDIADSLGLLESLIIVRLLSSVHGFAINLNERIRDLHKAQAHTGFVPRTDRSIDDDNAHAGIEQEGEETDPEVLQLQTALLIEDSLLMLFGDNSVPEGLEMQANVHRNSGVRSSHLMSAVLSAVTLPQKFLNNRLGEIKKEREDAAAGPADEIQSEISSQLGVSKGTGAIDILAFAIALFTMKEDSLLSLLTPEQFESLEREFSSGFFEQINRTPIAQAVNDVTIRAYDVYKLFLRILEGPRSLFVFNQDAE
tara:strand:- start:1528 stop:3597 length:2070 start_codon:yes stop_codon:yes gene_type:complete